jgi:uncharacterized caspase-like protein
LMAYRRAQNLVHTDSFKANGDMKKNQKILAALCVFCSTNALAPLTAGAQQAAQNPRIALVVGNSVYKDQALATAANDAGLVAQTLQAAGYDVVGARDLDEKSLRTAFRDFLDKAATAGPEMQAFVYLSGRGVQYDGDNYFVPVDAQINRDSDVPIDALRISDFTRALAATPGKARIVVLDAARANSYATQGAPLAPGLTLVDPEPGELLAYNASPGALAGDEQGPYGIYGKTLAGAMRHGGVRIEDVFDQTRVQVNQATRGAVVPWSASKLSEPYYLFERAADAPVPALIAQADAANRSIASFPATDAYSVAVQRDTMQGYEEYLKAYPNSDQARRVRAILAARREALFWRRSINANNPRAHWTYLRVYPKGPHVADARRRLTILAARYEPPADFEALVYEDLPPPPPDERFYEAQPYYSFDEFGPPPPPPPAGFYYDEGVEWRDLPPPRPPREIGVLPILGVAIPLVAGAIAVRDHSHRNGIAPPGARPAPPPPPAPPPLPIHVRPAPPPVPVGMPGNRPNFGIVKPLPPIAPIAPLPGGRPPANAGAPGGKPLPIPPGAPIANPAPRPLPGPGPVPNLAPGIGPKPPLAPSFRPAPAAPLVRPPAPPPIVRAPPPAPVFRTPLPATPIVRQPPTPGPVLREPRPGPGFRPPVVGGPRPGPGPGPGQRPGPGRQRDCGKPGLPACPN